MRILLLFVLILLIGCGGPVTPNIDPKEIIPQEEGYGPIIVNDEKTTPIDVKDLRIYQINVESFVDGSRLHNANNAWGPSSHKGDLRGIIKALPYIKDLGMNAIWLTPIFESKGDTKTDGTGYYPTNYFKIDPKFGTLEDAKELVKRAHALNLYVFLDGVFGHHKAELISSSPSGLDLYPLGVKEIEYPASLPFIKEVITYWMNELNIWYIKYHDYLSEKTINEQTGRYWYTHKLIRRSYFTIKRALPNMFQYIKNPQIPKTTNGIEGYFSHLKNHLDLHRGLTLKNRINFIKWYVYFSLTTQASIFRFTALKYPLF